MWAAVLLATAGLATLSLQGVAMGSGELLTLLGALPVYRRVARESYRGEGSIAIRLVHDLFAAEQLHPPDRV